MILPLYSGLLPHAILFLRRLPVLGHFLNLPGVKTVSVPSVEVVTEGKPRMISVVITERER